MNLNLGEGGKRNEKSLNKTDISGFLSFDYNLHASHFNLICFRIAIKRSVAAVAAAMANGIEKNHVASLRDPDEVKRIPVVFTHCMSNQYP